MRFGNVVGGGHDVMVKRVTSAGYEVVGWALTARLLHLSTNPDADDVLTHLAISLVLARMVPWILVLRARRSGVSLAEQARLFLDSALRHARSRRRERDRRKTRRAAKLHGSS